jgi:phage terminase large subunit-like protein
LIQLLEPSDGRSGRDKVLDALDEFCPHIARNQFIPHWPHPKQTILLAAASRGNRDGTPYEALFGGAAGGGKSDALLMAAAQYLHLPHYRAMLIRQTYAELTRAGALMDRAMKWWLPIKGVKWNGDEKRFTFPSGASVEFGYHSHPTDDAKFHGGEWHFVGFDELTNWKTKAAFEWVRSRIRKNEGDPIPLRIIGTANPGGPGHDWVKERFIDDGPMKRGNFFPSTINDNPSLDREAYIRTLSSMHPTRREQLLLGNWDAREPGQYFRREWFGPMLDPSTDLWASSECVRVRWWDFAASEKEGAAFTAGVRMARHRSGVRAIEHCESFRATPGKRDARIAQVARADGPTVTVGLEIEPGSGGIAQFLSIEKTLQSAGFRVVGARPRADLGNRDAKYLLRGSENMHSKERRAEPVAACLERGYQRRGECEDTGEIWWGADAGRRLNAERDGIRIFAWPTVNQYLSIMEGFPDGATCDEVDATSGAWAWLEPRGGGTSSPPVESRRRPEGSDSPDIHPDERARSRPQKWTP